jgi:hypothetical protein
LRRGQSTSYGRQEFAGGKAVDFSFLNLSLGSGNGQYVVFTIIEANHHTEDWTYVMLDAKAIHVHFALVQAK